MQKFLSFIFSIRIYFLFIINITIFLIPLQAYENKNKMERNIVPKNIEYPLDENFIMGELDNKLRYFIRESDNPKNTVIVKLSINVGSAYEEDHEQGIAHFLEHLAFNGTKNFPGTSIVDFMRKKGLGSGGHYNASTGFYITNYYLELPSPTEDVETFRTGLQIIRDWLFYITFDSEEIEKERGVVLSELRDRLGLMNDVSEALISNVYRDSVLSKRFPIGKKEYIEQFTKKDFEQFYKRWYHPQNATLAIVGDIDFDIYASLIKQIFSVPVEREFEFPDYSLFEAPFIVREDIADIFTIQSEQSTTSDMLVAFKIPVLPTIISIKDVEQNLLFQLLLRSINNRLFELVQEENSSLLSADVFPLTLNRNLAPVILFYITTDINRKEEGIEKFVSSLTRLYQYGFSELEIENTKQQIVSSLYVEKGVEGRNSYELMNSIDRLIEENDFINFVDLHWLSESVHDLLDPFKKEHLHYLISDIFEREDRVIIFSEKEESIEKNTIRQLFAKSIARQYEPLKEEEQQQTLLFSPILQISPNEKAIVSEYYYKESDIYKWELKNGITVYSKNTDFEENSIYFSASKKISEIEMFSDPEEFDIAYAFNDIISNSGLANLSAKEYRQYRSKLQSSFDSYVTNRELAITGYAKTFEFEEGMKLLYENLVYPKFDQKAIDIWKNERKSELDAEKNEPYNIYYDRISRILCDYDTYYYPIKKSTINSVTRDMLSAIHEKIYGNFNGWKIFFVGNLDKIDFKNNIVKYIANLPYNPSEALQESNSLGCSDFKNVRNIELEFESIEESSTLVELFIPMNKDMFLFDKIILSSALSILINSRVNDIIREDLGLSYSPYAYVSYDEREDMLSMSANVSHEKKNRQKIIQELVNIVQDVSVGNISLTDLQNIKKTIIEQRYDFFDSNPAILKYFQNAMFERDDNQFIKDYVFPGYTFDILVEDLTIDKIIDFVKYILQEYQGLLVATISSTEE